MLHIVQLAEFPLVFAATCIFWTNLISILPMKTANICSDDLNLKTNIKIKVDFIEKNYDDFPSADSDNFIEKTYFNIIASDF